MANDLDFTYDEEEQRIMEEMSAMSEMERERMLDDMYQQALQVVGERDYLTEAFQILDGEPTETQKQHLEALGRYYAAKLSLAAA
jgi:hypothetical protein